MIGWNDGRGVIFRDLPGSVPGSPEILDSVDSSGKSEKHENMPGAK